MIKTITKNCRLLVIDDNPAIHEDFKRVLSRAEEATSLQLGRSLFNFQTPSASDASLPFEIDSSFQGEDGLHRVIQARVEGRPYAAVFVDVRMPPGWDGIETLERIWKADPDVEAVICTAFSDYSWEDIDRRFGRSCQLLILKKPFDKIELQQMATTSVERWNLKQEARLAASDLQITNERLSTTLHAIDDAVITTDVHGCVMEMNPAAQRLIGMPRETAKGKHLREIMGLRDACTNHPLENPIDDVLRYDRSLSLSENAELVRGDNVVIAVDDYMSPIHNEARQITGAVVVLRDVTEKRHAQQQIRQLYQQSLEANRMKDEFLAIVSHELRTPLQSIISWLDLLKAGRLTHEETERAIQVIERNTKTQRQLVEDLLDISRIVSGKMVLHPEVVSVADVIANSVETVRFAAKNKCIDLIVNVQPRMAPVYADPERLQQIVWNLLTNAIKFTPQYGLIRLTASQEHNEINIVVSDNGQGIAPDFLPYVFERFHQETNRAQGGTKIGLGLGLSIVKHLVELHGGRVTACSDGKDKGASFGVVLPVAGHVCNSNSDYGT